MPKKWDYQDILAMQLAIAALRFATEPRMWEQFRNWLLESYASGEQANPELAAWIPKLGRANMMGAQMSLTVSVGELAHEAGLA